MGGGSMMSRMMHGDQNMGDMMNENQGMSNQTMTNNGTGFSILRFDITTDEIDPITLYTKLPANAQINTRYTLANTTNSKERQFIMSMAGMNQGKNMPQMAKHLIQNELTNL